MLIEPDQRTSSGSEDYLPSLLSNKAAHAPRNILRSHPLVQKSDTRMGMSIPALDSIEELCFSEPGQDACYAHIVRSHLDPESIGQSHKSGLGC